MIWTQNMVGNRSPTNNYDWLMVVILFSSAQIWWEMSNLNEIFRKSYGYFCEWKDFSHYFKEDEENHFGNVNPSIVIHYFSHTANIVKSYTPDREWETDRERDKASKRIKNGNSSNKTAKKIKSRATHIHTHTFIHTETSSEFLSGE